MLNAAEWRPARIETSAPLLVVVVDTEEEFDWSRPLARKNIAVSAMRAQEKAHRIFEPFAIRPTYVIDYPVVSQEDGRRPLLELLASGQCEIGTHLHPWVSPPFQEEVTNYNSYPGNLPQALEREKLRVLTQEIAERFGARPRVYKAGRYGVGRATAAILEELGYEIDASVVPESDFSPEEGPDFSGLPVSPYWFGRTRPLLELPVTQAVVGWLAGSDGVVERSPRGSLARRLHIPGLLARTHAIERIRLSPEGMTFGEMRRLTRALHGRGVRVFSFTYHSPSLAAGHTPYTPDAPSLDRFLDRFRRYFDWFMGELGGRASSPAEILALARATVAAAPEGQ
jgi:hypothetical protein